MPIRSTLVLALALLSSSATAFAPSAPRTATSSALKAGLNGWTPDSNAFAYGLPGSLDPVGDFDPNNFLQDKTLEEVKMLREAEITHGRVSMLAVVGFFAQERAHFLFVEPDKDIGPAIRHLDEVRQVSPFFFEGLALVIACVELYRSLYGWVSPNALPDGKNRQLADDYYPGDVGFDPLGLKPTDGAEFAEMATKEIQHGRLAMLAIAGFVAQELVDGKLIASDFGKMELLSIWQGFTNTAN